MALFGLIAYRLAAHVLGAEGFALYALARRVLATLLPALVLGFGVALPRAVAAMEKGEGALMAGAALVLSVVSLVVWGVGLSAEGFLAELFFGNPLAQNLVLPLCLIATGSLGFSLLYGLWRGLLWTHSAALAQVVGLGSTPLVGLVLSGGSLVSALWWQGGLLAGGSWLAVGWQIVRAQREEQASMGLREIEQSARELLRFGLPRVPGDGALMMLLGVPALVVVQVGTLEAAGAVAFGMTFVTLVGAALGPLSTLLLPYAVRSGRSGRNQLYRAAWAGWGLAAVGCGAGIVLAEPLTSLVLGEGYRELAPIVGLCLAGAVGYAAFVAFRSLNDAWYTRVVNAHSAIGALVVYSVALLGLYAFGVRTVMTEYVLGLFVLAMAGLGARTMWLARQAR